MKLFQRNPNLFASTPTVSTASDDAQLGFWQRNRKGVLLFGGCAALLLASRFYASRSRSAAHEAKANKVVEATARDEADKDGQIAALKARFGTEHQKQEIAEQQALASALAANELTPDQKRVLALGGGDATQATAAVAAAQPEARMSRYSPGESGEARAAEKPSTLVISYREQGPGLANAAPVAQVEAPPAPPMAFAPGSGLPVATPTATDEEREGHTRRDGTPRFDEKKANPEDQQHALAVSSGEKYRVREGTWLPCTEMLRINGSFASDIDCLISIPIYSTSGARLLIPQGTLALGHAAAVNSQNQQRLFVVFDSFIMPDGYTVRYENAAGLDQIGQTGLRDKVNHHYLQMFGASVAIAAVGGLAQIGNYGNSNITAGSQYRSGVTQGMSESSVQILNRFANILPTFIIREGARNNIHLPFNLWLPDVAKHHMGGDL